MLHATDIGDERFEQALRNMSERDQALLHMRFGSLDGQVHPLEEVEDAFGLTRKQGREIEARFMCLLRGLRRDPPDVA